MLTFCYRFLSEFPFYLHTLAKNVTRLKYWHHARGNAKIILIWVAAKFVYFAFVSKFPYEMIFG
jgi:hypothetical protein